MKYLLPILFLLLQVTASHAQNDSLQSGENRINKDSIQKQALNPQVALASDSLRDVQEVDSLHKDSVQRAALKPLMIQPDTVTYNKYYQHPWLAMNKPTIFQIMPQREEQGKDSIFYFLTGMVALLASIRLIFPKYFRNLFMLLMQTSIRQKQTREQLLQNNPASILLNLLFILSAGFYIALIIQYRQLLQASLYQLMLYSCILLFAIYLFKHLFLIFSGWVFNVPEATSAYSFIVLMINKVYGVVIIPFILLISFSPMPVMQVSLTLSIGITILFFIYRYLISFGVVRTNLKVNAFHFFLYLCAVELLPLLLIYKLLLKLIAGGF